MTLIFSASAIVDRRNPEPVREAVLNASMFVLPGLSLLAAAVLRYPAFARPMPLSHLWHLAPLVACGGDVALAAWAMR